MHKDRFSALADQYAHYRPHYPPELYQTLLKHTPGRSRVWDCATGSGQAAEALSAFFDRVEATDISRHQLEKAPPHPKVHYQVCPAEKTTFSDAYFDLITVATALHWFDIPTFFKEVARVGQRSATLAFWCYGLFSCEVPAINSLIEELYQNTLGPWWDPERQWVDEGYASIAVPFQRITQTTILHELSWKQDHVLGYLSTWSARKRFLDAGNLDPLPELKQRFQTYWNEDQPLVFHFPIYLHLYRLP